jgi:hypothetical protein
MKARIPKEKLEEIRRQNNKEVEVDRDMSLKDYDELIDSYGKGGVTTSVGDVESPWGISLATEFDTELMLEEINASDPKIVIETTDQKLIEVCTRFRIIAHKVSPLDTLRNLPYDDMIIDLHSSKVEKASMGLRVIIDKSSIPSEKEAKKYKCHNIGYLLVESSTEHDDERYYVGMRLSIIYTKQKKLSFSLSHTDGTFRVTDDPVLRKEYRDKVFNCDESVKERFIDKDGNNIEALMFKSINIWVAVVTALKNPEIREIWETKSREYSKNTTPSPYVYNSKPLENIKRIYMCEPHHTGRELTRHTDKWYVREHIAHSKYGKEYVRRGHYKGPKAKDDAVKAQPRKHTVDTYDNSNIDRDDLKEFFEQLKKNHPAN